MWAAIGAILQIVFLFLKDRFEKDAAERARKDILYAEAKTAIANRDLSGITASLDGLRSK